MTAQPHHQDRDDRLPADRVDCHAGQRWADADDRRRGYQRDQLDPDTGRPWRLLKSHDAGCDDPLCTGCAICPERHCQVCAWRHVTVDGRGTDLTCPPCLAATRRAIANVWDCASELFSEALYRGTNATAAGLAGPVANIEAWSYRRLSALANRIPAGWLDEQRDDHHPLWVLGTWEREARHTLGQTLSPGSAQPTLTEARDYLDQHLHRLAHADGFAFDELALDVGRCLEHLRRVLRSDDHADRGAPCPQCGRADLQKSFGEIESDDRWTCPSCRQWWDEESYRKRVEGTHMHVATVLPASQIREVYRVSEGRVRKWAERGKVRKRGRDGQGRMLYVVADVLAAREAQEQRSRPTAEDDG